MNPVPSAANGAGRPGLSPNILLITLIFSGLGVAIGAGGLDGSGAAFAFVMAGWVLGLCLHAFGHALVGARWGLSDGEARTLDPLRAPDPVASVVLPVILTILAGLGFPGGAAPAGAGEGLSPGRRSAVAASGPASSLGFLMVLVLLYALAGPNSEILRAVLAVSVLFQATGLVLSLMPVPGLDGYGILRPWLPGDWSWSDRMARHASLVLFGLFLLSGTFSRPLFRASLRLTAGLGIDLSDVIAGYRLIRLW